MTGDQRAIAWLWLLALSAVAAAVIGWMWLLGVWS